MERENHTLYAGNMDFVWGQSKSGPALSRGPCMQFTYSQYVFDFWWGDRVTGVPLVDIWKTI